MLVRSRTANWKPRSCRLWKKPGRRRNNARIPPLQSRLHPSLRLLGRLYANPEKTWGVQVTAVTGQGQGRASQITEKHKEAVDRICQSLAICKRTPCSSGFKGVRYPKSVALHAVFFHLRYAVSHRDLEEILAERGVDVDRATLNRRVVKFAPLIAAQAQARKRPTAKSWRMDETCIKVKGKWTCLYRAVDRDGQTLDFMLSERRNLAAARRFFKQAIGANGVPERVVIDKSGANLAGLQAVNAILKFTGNGRMIGMRQVKFLNNILEQDHRFIKRITAPMMGFKVCHSAAATIAGIETAHMIRKGQFGATGLPAFPQFAQLAA